MFASKDLFFSKPSGYQISRSVRTRSSASAYLNRTPSSASNQRVMTFSAWVKRGAFGGAGYQLLFSAHTGTDASFIGYGNGSFTGSGDYFEVGDSSTGSTLVFDVRSNAVYRDPSSWYHVVVAIDTTQATAANRMLLYVNGVQLSSTTTGTVTLNYQMNFNSNVVHNIGRLSRDANSYFDGYLTEINFIDGQQLTPSSFGQYNAYGVWSPLKYTGTYGTNGFYLNFSDNSAATATTIGKDYSGNGNNWTPNNISVTAGTTYDSMIDVPTLYGDGGTGRGNYCVLNPLYTAGGGIFTNGNLQVATGTSTAGRAISTMGVSSGKWYWEITPTSIPAGGVSIGIVPIPTTNDSGTVGNNASEYGYLSGGNKFSGGSSTAYGASYVANDVIGIALDVDGGTITFYKNNTSQGTAFSSITATTYIPAVSDTSSSDTATLVANFGQRPFTYTPPTGFNALNTQNLPTPTIGNGATVMAATTYTGTGAALSVSNAVNGVSFKPDFVWVKCRSSVTNNILENSVIGPNYLLVSNSTAAEVNSNLYISAFNSNGFTVQSTGDVGANAATYVGWQWQAGQGSTSSNTSGSITSTVSVNATAGFSIVTYTGNGSTGTVGHGLGVTPNMVIVKNRGAATDWAVWTPDIYLSQGTYLLYLNTTAAKTATSAWNNSNFASTYFPVGSSSLTNSNATNYVAFCWAAVKGYSAFGSYTGNGSADGPFVYTGFRPRWIMIKRTDTTGSWDIFDTSRSASGGSNEVAYALFPDLANAESAPVANGGFDLLSNGFKNRGTNAERNASGGTYIYAAFAENPFKYSLAR
jgi:hypothetical protein